LPEDILTVPTETRVYKPLLVTGNEYMSLPDINPRDGGIRSLNVLHMGAKGLIEFAGIKEPLILPFLKLGGRKADLRLTWSYRHSWLPVLLGRVGKIQLKGIIYAPIGHRGAVYLLEFENTGEKPVSFEAGFNVKWDTVRHQIFKAAEISGGHTIFYDEWTKSLVLEARSGLPLAALSLGLDTDLKWLVRPRESGFGRGEGVKQINLKPGQRASLPLYLAVNIEGSGAGATVVDLRRRGFATLLADTEEWLELRKMKLTQHEAVANRNLFFNYFFSLGRAIDSDELVPVTSRSPRYYVSAAFWSRDCLLWSFPGLLLADKVTSRQVLLAVFGRHLEKAGEHAHYINGVLLYPGFELDQLSSYVLAVKAYLAKTGDTTILKEKVIKRGLPAVAGKLLQMRDTETGLYSTFLDPSDDPVKYAFLIYDNALAQRALAFLSRLQREKALVFRADLSTLAAALRRAVYRYGVVEGPFGPMFAWSVDGGGSYELYDNPPGSLQLLAYYGFCGKNEAAYRNTVRWVHSLHNPYYCHGGPIKGAASRHAVNPWPMSFVNDLLSLNLDKGNFFGRAPMDNGFFCETVDPHRGRAATGQAFASASGFLAFALRHTYFRKT